MTNFRKQFEQCQTLEELKKLYRKLAMIHHPDRGGNLRDMQEINNLYELHFDRCKRNSEKAKKTHDSETKEQTEQTFNETSSDYIDLINELMPLDGLEINVCGSWLWIAGQTYLHKEKLKELGFRYSKTKKQWYKPMETTLGKRKKRGHYSMEQIYEKYGRNTYQSKAMAALPR